MQISFRVAISLGVAVRAHAARALTRIRDRVCGIAWTFGSDFQ